MVKKTKTNRKNGNTRKRYSSSSSSSSIYSNFEKQVTVIFFEMLLMVKLFHWKTYSYATHKATDELYAKLNEHMDQFIEVLLGKTGIRINLLNNKKISLIDLSSPEQLRAKVDEYKKYLVSLSNNRAINSMNDTDLLNIRDEILGDMNQFLYLLTFK
jgi:DNA-binding ferritin-like protein